MDDLSRTVLLLAGRLGDPDDIGPIAPLLEQLANQGIAAQVLCVAQADAGSAGFRVFELPGLGRRWHRSLAIRRLRFDEGLRRPELLHVIDPSMGAAGLAIAEQAKIPYVQTVNEFLPPQARLRLSRRWCRGLIATSRDLAEDLVQNLNVPRDFLSVIPPGIAIPDESSATTRRGNVPVIGTAGALAANAGMATFLNAARRVIDAGIDAEFLIAGQGESDGDLRRRAGRLRIADRVTFAGRQVFGPRFWGVLDVFCQTSLFPTVGRTLAQAMAFGVPCIANDLEGLQALVKHGETGVRVPPGDSGALARTILELLADPGRTLALGLAGREAIRRDFDPATEARLLAGLYRRTLNGYPVAVPSLVLT